MVSYVYHKGKANGQGGGEGRVLALNWASLQGPVLVFVFLLSDGVGGCFWC